MTAADIIVCTILFIVIILIVYNHFFRGSSANCKGCNNVKQCQLIKKSNWIEEYKKDNCH